MPERQFCTECDVESLRAQLAVLDCDKSYAVQEALELRKERDAALERVKALEVPATELINSMDALISESHGVAGLHLNGDVAPWDSLASGGQFEGWLSALDVLRAALAGEQDQGA